MMRPPSTRWVPADTNRFACFLSHFKAESGSDARYLRDLLQRMLGCPVFLDSSDLTDLRALFTDGVHRSDVLVLLATEKLLTRPWCILELWEAVKKQIPVVIMEVRGRGWDVADACHLLENLDTELPLRNPGALEEVQKYVGSDKPLAEVTAAMRAAIEEADQHAVSWTPHGTDNQVLAAALDLSDAMAAVTGRDLAWKDRDDAPLARDTIDSTPGRSSAADADAQPPGYLTLEEPTSMGSRASAESSSSERRGSDGERRSSDASKYAVFVAHHRAAAGSDARFLHAQLERALGARCFLGGGDTHGRTSAVEGLAHSRTLLLVQTAGVLTVPSVLLECYAAVTRGLPLVCVRLISEDVDAYDFDDARALLDDLPNELPRRAGAEALAALEAGAARLGADVPTVAATLAATLPQLISCELDPAGTDNQVNAALRDIVDRLKKQIHQKKKKTKDKRAPATTEVAVEVDAVALAMDAAAVAQALEAADAAGVHLDEMSSGRKRSFGYV